MQDLRCLHLSSLVCTVHSTKEEKSMKRSLTGQNVMPALAVEHAHLSELHQPCRSWQKHLDWLCREVHLCQLQVRIC